MTSAGCASAFAVRAARRSPGFSCGLPSFTPLAFAAANAAIVRVEIISRSAARETACSDRRATSVIWTFSGRNVWPFTQAHAGGGDASPGNADACARFAGADASDYAALHRDRKQHGRVGDACRARGGAHAQGAHANARDHGSRRGADRRRLPSTELRRSL